MLSRSEARDRILAAVSPLDTERVSVFDAVGRVLDETVVARRDLPAWDNSAMDGYAVRAAEATEGATLPVSDEIPAGDAGDRPLAPGTVARIFTGAPVPPGADTVVMQENTSREGDHVTFTQAAEHGRHIRRAGTDVRAGTTVLQPGRVLTPGDIAMLATQGRSLANVVRAPVVAIASTGDELLEVDGGDPGPGQITNGNTVALASAVRALGGIPRIYPIIRDDRAVTLDAIRRAARADALITSGGVSVGDYDFVGDALVELSGKAFEFWKVAIKPGKPIAFGHVGDCACFGLPGNPISALVTFEVFVRPALLRMLGHTRVVRPSYEAVLDSPLRAGGKREEYMRASARFEEGVLHVDHDRTQSSGALASMCGADALLRNPAGAPARDVGDTVEVFLLGPENPLCYV
jgi:molybdopterin molybdotransferase